jgi:hypothetical protein
MGGGDLGNKKEASLQDQSHLLQQFLSAYPCLPAPPRPNTSIKFQLYDHTRRPLHDTPSSLNANAWEVLLQPYPGELGTQLGNILRYGCMLGYEGPERFQITPNLKTAFDLPHVMDKNVHCDLELGRIVRVEKPTFPFQSSPLGFVPKSNGKHRKIHHLSAPDKKSVNDFIPEQAAYIEFVAFERVLQMVADAGVDCDLFTRDQKDAYRAIPIAPYQRWLMGFEWRGVYYTEAVLPFGLSSAPFIYNLFAEGLHWILKSYFRWEFFEHYLDDTMIALRAALVAEGGGQKLETEYELVTTLLGVLCNVDKNNRGRKVKWLGRMVDSHTMTVSVPEDKLQRIIDLTKHALKEGSLTLLEAQSLAGLLAFCAPAVQLGYLFCRRLWTFIASFRKGWPRAYRKRIPAPVREDLEWWNKLFPVHNGVRFFDDEKREVVHLFTDACGLGLGGFYINGLGSEDCRWQEHVAKIPRSQSYQIQSQQDASQPFDINIEEVTAVLQAFKIWGQAWRGKTLVVYSDNTTTQLGLVKQSVKSAANVPLREVLLRAAQMDIRVEPRRVIGEDNGLADALSRFLQHKISNWCPHWQ